MKTMYKKIVLRSLMLLLAVGLVFGISSCSRDDDGGGSTKDGNMYKITITLNGVDANDYVSLAAAASDAAATTSVWKINGVTQNGQVGVGLNNTNFTGSTKTYVLETNFKVIALAAGGQIINYGGAITGSYKIEKNGKEEVNETINLSTDGASWSKQFNF